MSILPETVAVPTLVVTVPVIEWLESALSHVSKYVNVWLLSNDDVISAFTD